MCCMMAGRSMSFAYVLLTLFVILISSHSVSETPRSSLSTKKTHRGTVSTRPKTISPFDKYLEECKNIRRELKSVPKDMRQEVLLKKLATERMEKQNALEKIDELLNEKEMIEKQLEGCQNGSLNANLATERS